MFCPNCGVDISNAPFCSQCGTRVIDLEQAPVPPTPMTGMPVKKNYLGNTIGVVVVLALLAWAVFGLLTDHSGDPLPAVPSTPVASDPEPVTHKMAWKQVAKFSGNSEKKTPSFMLGDGEKRLKYRVTGGDAVLCGIYVLPTGSSFEREGGFAEVTVTESANDYTMLTKDAGEYYVYANACNCRWTVTIEELQ